MSGHTPGLWHVLQPDPIMGSEGGQGLMILDANRQTLAEVFLVDKGDAQQNAQLMAAAPDLLNACKNIDTFFVFFDSWCPPGLGVGAKQALILVKAAIAKAEAA